VRHMHCRKDYTHRRQEGMTAGRRIQDCSTRLQGTISRVRTLIREQRFLQEALEPIRKDQDP